MAQQAQQAQEHQQQQVQALPQQPPLALRGTLLHMRRGHIGSVEVLRDSLVVVDAAGSIAHVGPATDEEAAGAALARAGLAWADVLQLRARQFLLPGFVDTHVHAPQYAFAGVGTDLPLFDWLSTRTFPCERAFEDSAHAAAVYSACVARLLRLGTTTANYFATLHVDATKVLVDCVMAAGQRAVIGKVCMDTGHGPDYLDVSAAASLQGGREVVAYIQGLGCSRVQPAVVPRFIPSCSEELLSGLGQLAAEAGGITIHSHIAESRDQVALSRELHPGHPDDAAIYDAAGLLTARAVYAHATQLGPDGMRRLAARGAAIAHCPLSNMWFGDALLDVAAALACGVKVGLGTDVAGGYSPSMLVAQRLAVINSHALKVAKLMAQPQLQPQPQPQLQPPQQPQPPQQTQPQQELEQQQERQAAGAAAGLAGSRVAAAISNPAVARAAREHMLTWEDALYLATVGGAEALGLGDRVGSFAAGFEFDALLVDAGLGHAFDVLQPEAEAQPLLLLEAFLNNGDDRSIVAVWVQGRACPLPQ